MIETTSVRVPRAGADQQYVQRVPTPRRVGPTYRYRCSNLVADELRGIIR